MVVLYGLTFFCSQDSMFIFYFSFFHTTALGSPTVVHALFGGRSPRKIFAPAIPPFNNLDGGELGVV